jgi:ligand-binding SRPBCC domain-containing protein
MLSDEKEARTRRGTIESMSQSGSHSMSHNAPQRFEARQWVPYPVELVFAFFANPANLPHLMPRKFETRIEDARIEPPPPRPVAPDESRRFSFYPIPWVPRRVSWLASITEFRWNSHFCDAQLRGPFTAFNHRHGIEAEFRDGQEGTLVSDVVEYALPYGFMGRIAGAMVRRQLTRSFAFRQKRLPEILAATQKQAARTA